ASSRPSRSANRLCRNARVQVLPDFGYDASQRMPWTSLGEGLIEAGMIEPCEPNLLAPRGIVCKHESERFPDGPVHHSVGFWGDESRNTHHLFLRTSQRPGLQCLL